ncbi:MAG: hypothetical protein Q4G67_12395 [Actinomycetia bacterium]|nr:hypothetical protein [Actinomycetes bacterium]
MFDSLTVYADELAAVLDDGERLVASATVSYTAGREETGEPSGGVTWDIFGLDVPAWNAAAERVVGGTTLVGSPGSLAGQLARSMGAAGELILTDRRILVARPISVGRPADVEWGQPVSAVVDVRHDPRLLQRGRIRLTMRDGSMVRLMAGMLTRRQAARVVDGWSGLQSG